MAEDVKRTRWLAREFKELAEYAVRREDTGAAPRNRQQLDDYSSGRAPLGHATVPLRLLASLRGAIGCAKVIAGDERGFSDIDLACLYNYWSIRILTRSFDLNERPDKQGHVLMDGVASCWMHAEAIGALGLRQWLDKLVTETASGYLGVRGRDMNALCTLVAHYATRRPIAELERAGWAPIGAYASLLGGSFTARDYDALAAYHQACVEEDDDEGHPPFHTYPYRVIPFELLAISRRTGIPIEGEHPLLTTSLMRLRDVAEIPMSDELRGVVDRASKDLSFDQEPR